MSPIIQIAETPTPVFHPIQESSSFTYRSPFEDANPHLYLVQSTTAGSHVTDLVLEPAPPLREIRSTAEAVTEIRRFSGLTWDQIGELFGRDRRTAQFWASGRPLRPVNQERLLRAYSILLRTDCGSPSATLAFLLDASHGPSLKDLLTQQAWELAENRVKGRQPVPRSEEPPTLSPEQRAGRLPISLAEQMEDSGMPPRIAPTGTSRIRPPRRRGA